MRNRIVHAYFDIDLDIVWQVITQDLGLLLIEVEKGQQHEFGSWIHLKF